VAVSAKWQRELEAKWRALPEEARNAVREKVLRETPVLRRRGDTYLLKLRLIEPKRQGGRGGRPETPCLPVPRRASSYSDTQSSVFPCPPGDRTVSPVFDT
jgi:hypothetical protein